MALLKTLVFTSLFALAGCGQSQDAPTAGGDSAVSDQARTATTVNLTDAEMEDIVRRSYQYVAMYNVNNKFAMDPGNPMSTGGWNRIRANTALAEQPEGVPAENWLPLVRGDYGIDIIMRIYAPDLERFATWTAPQAEILN